MTSQIVPFASIKAYTFGQSNLNVGTAQSFESGQWVHVLMWQNKLGVLLKTEIVYELYELTAMMTTT